MVCISSTVHGVGDGSPKLENVMQDLWSPEYWEQKAWKRVHDAKAEDFLPWEEAKIKYIETKIQPLLQQYRESDHSWFKDWNRRRGEMMHSSDLIYRLQKINPHIFVEQQINFPEDWGLYVEVGSRIQYISAVPKKWLTEFSYSIVDKRDLPLEERRGWRTVVVLCLLKGVLTWEEVLREFGEPQDGFNDQRWQETVMDFKRGGDQVAQRNISNAVDP